MCKAEFSMSMEKPHDATIFPATVPTAGLNSEKGGTTHETITPVEDPEKAIEQLHHEPSGNNPVQIDVAAEARLLRKLDMNLIPLLFVMYRSNIGNAKIAGMSHDLHFSASGSSYTWLLTIFYIAYILFGFSALIWKVVPPHIWASSMILCWGIVSSLQATTGSWGGMMALRFFLGAFEAGFGPGVPFYLSFFYMRRELGLRCGMFLSAGPLATCFAGALAYGITSGHAGIKNWRLLFLVEGLPCLLMAGVAFFFLPDLPSKARFLDEDDKAVARARGVRQIGGEEAGLNKRIGSIVWKDFGAGLLDVKNYLIAAMYFSCNVSFSSLPVFLPTIINEMGFSPINAQGLSAPPYFISFLTVLLSTHLADRHAQRGITIAILSLVGATGYILLAATTLTSIRYFAVYLAAIGVFPTIINILPWVLNNQGSDTKRGTGLAMLNVVGQCGPLLGTRIYPAADAPYYRVGMWTCAGFMLGVAGLSMVLRMLLVRENRRFDEKFGRVGEAGDTEGGCENDGPNFRYVL